GYRPVVNDEGRAVVKVRHAEDLQRVPRVVNLVEKDRVLLRPVNGDLPLRLVHLHRARLVNVAERERVPGLPAVGRLREAEVARARRDREVADGHVAYAVAEARDPLAVVGRARAVLLALADADEVARAVGGE